MRAEHSATCWRASKSGLCLVLVLSFAPFAWVALEADLASAGGDLDDSFGSGGTVSTLKPGLSEGVAMVVQPDGKVVVGGSKCGNGYSTGGTNPSCDFALIRYEANGSPDRTFGDEGLALADPAGPQGDFVFSLLLQPDGKIVAGGMSRGRNPTQGAGSDFALVRFNPEGDLDRTFGLEGIVTTPVSYQSHITSLALQPDGKIVAGGYNTNDSAVVRYLPNGILDPGFSAGGIYRTFDGDGQYVLRSVALRGDGSILAMIDGELVVPSGPGDFFSSTVFIQLTDSGVPDPGFGELGKVVKVRPTGTGGPDEMFIDPDGKIVVAGSACADAEIQQGGECDFQLSRFSAEAVEDATFGNNGVVTTDFGDVQDRAYALTRHHGRYLVAGQSGSSFDCNPAPCRGSSKVALARYNLDGTADLSFGQDGKVTTAFAGRYAVAAAAGVQPGDKLVVGGGAKLQDHGFLLARYLPNAADLSLSMVDSPDPVELSGDLAYTLTVRNSGPDPAEDVKLADTLPPEVNEGTVVVSSGQGTCTQSGRVIDCELGTLPKDAASTVSVNVRAPSTPLRLTNRATVTAGTQDSSVVNNSVSALTDVVDTSVAVPREAPQVITTTPPDAQNPPPPSSPEPVGVAPPAAGGVTSSSGAAAPPGPPATPPGGPGASLAPVSTPVSGHLGVPDTGLVAARPGAGAALQSGQPMAVLQIPGHIPGPSLAIPNADDQSLQGAPAFNMVGPGQAGIALGFALLAAAAPILFQCDLLRRRRPIIEGSVPRERPAFAMARL